MDVGLGLAVAVAVGLGLAVGVGLGVPLPIGRLDRNHHRRACLEVADCRTGTLRRLIGIEPEIIQRAAANRVGVLILRKRFGVPSDRACVLRNCPRRAAITLIVERAVVCPAGFLDAARETRC